MPGFGQPEMRRFGDYEATKNNIYDGAMRAVQAIPPVENQRYSLTIQDPGWSGSGEFGVAEHKNALLTGRTLGRRLSGTFTLTDKATGGVVDSRRMTVASVPALTKQGSFVLDGSNYVLCFHKGVQVWTEQGMIPIGDIVNKKMQLRVWSYDFAASEFVLRPITGWYKNRVSSKLGHAAFDAPGRFGISARRFSPTTLWATPDHNVLQRDGTKTQLFSTETLLGAEETLSSAAEQVIYGSLLGDATIGDDGVYRAHQCDAQKEYLQHKLQLLGPLVAAPLRRLERTRRKNPGIYWVGTTIAHASIYAARAACYAADGKKTVTTAWLDRINELGLATWFGDNGSVQSADGKNNSVRVALHTQSFSWSEIILIREWFRSRWGLTVTPWKSRTGVYRDRDMGWVVYIGATDADRFLQIVAPYLPACLHYKLGNKPTTGSCQVCAKTVARKRKYCLRCLAESVVQSGDKTLPTAAKLRFGRIATVVRAKAVEILASDGIELDGTESWRARTSVAGTWAPSEKELQFGYRLVDIRAKWLENTGRQYENTPFAYDIQVEGTHNYFANGILVSNCHQLRLLPGLYSRRKSNSELETHVNFLPGKGVPHRINLDPETGVFKLNVGQAEIPAVALMRAMGVTPGELEARWGKELAEINLKAEKPHHLDKLFERMGPAGPVPELRHEKVEALAAKVSASELDPWVSKRTLGHPHKFYDKHVMLTATGKLLDIARGKAEPDDRDNPAYAMVWGPEHLIAERLERSKPLLSKILWQATNAGNLKRVQPGPLTPAVRAAFLKSGLGLLPEGTSAAEHVDHGARITKIGEGGIGKSAESVPMSSRNVSAGQFPFIDSVRTSESESVGVDLRVAFGTKLGKDKRIYAPVRDARTGKIVYRSPQDLADRTVAFPNAHLEASATIPAIRGGKLTYVPRHEVDYHVPSMEQAFSPLTNMVPIKSASKPHRASMGGRMITQSLPLVNAEAPYVRSQVPGQPGKSFEELFGRHMGAVFANDKTPGVVEDVTPDKIIVRYADGARQTHETYNNVPSGRKSGIHAEALVRPGQTVAPGQILARSNYTDARGHAAYGLNARVAFMQHPGVYEDSIAVSRGFADRMKSDHLFKHEILNDEHTTIGKQAHAAAFPGKHPLELLKAFGDDGVIKPGTVVNKDDPLILAVRRRPGEFGKLSRSGRAGLTDASETWHYDEPGVVTDAINGPHGPIVVVKSQKTLQSGDKLCYDAETEILTTEGWKRVAFVTPCDSVASLRADGALEYIQPVATHAFPYTGRMYRLETTQVSMCVTPDHHLYAKPCDAAEYDLIKAEALSGTRYELKSDALWVGGDPAEIELPDSSYVRKCGRGGKGEKTIPPLVMRTETYALLLGAFLADGYTIYDPSAGDYGLGISQVKEENRDELRTALARENVKFVERPERFLIYSRGLAEHLRPLGKAATKHIPGYVFDWSPRLQRILFRWMNWGNGSQSETSLSFSTGSRQLADDYQRLCLHMGYAARVEVRAAADRPDSVKGVPAKTKKDAYYVRVYKQKLSPQINHGHVGARRGQSESWIDYDGTVYCVTLPRNHTLYTRRNGKAIWSGNSGRHGNKGIAVVFPDHEMPHGADGKPVDVILSSLGTVSRGNPSAIFEAALGKIASKTGQPYVFDDFQHGRDVGRYVQGELARHGVDLKEDLTDPRTGRTIPGVSVGSLYVMKLSHMAEHKAKGRGLGATDESGQPTRGQNNGAMRMSLGDTNALLSSGATSVIHDAHNYRGQANPEFWLSYMAGFPTPKPTVSEPFQRWLTELRASGVDPVHRDSRYHLMALTNARVKELAGDREVSNGETLDFSRNGEPYAGGLFDPRTFGAVDSKNVWAHIPLHEPMLNPVMEEPARRLLGLTEEKFRDVLAHKHSLPTGTGPTAIAAALAKIDVDKELKKTEELAVSSRKTARDDANRKLVYLYGLKKTGQSPKDWVLDSVPVLPPGFRPVTSGPGGVVVSDANLLYKDLFDANDALRRLSKETTDTGAEKLNVYDAVKAVMGLGDPVGAKNKERGVKGVLARLLGDTAKHGFYQQKILGSPTNLSGRAQALPNPDLDMDEVGIPEAIAWNVYHPFVVRRMVRQGIPRVEAARMAADKHPRAKRALLDEMADRPILMTRYPALHRHSVMAFNPRLMAGSGVQVNNLVTQPYGGDFDGDAYTLNVPLSDEAVKEAREKLFPSRNLFSPSSMKATTYLPNMEYTGGLHIASTMDENNNPIEFPNLAAAKAALARGEIGLKTRIRILNDSQST